MPEIRPGKVHAHVGQPFTGNAYDYAVVGGGRLGLCAAYYLRRLQPAARLLVVEQGGIPSEAGHTLHAPGVWHACGLPDAWLPRARWVRRVWADPAAETGTRRPHDPRFQPSGWAELTDGSAADAGLRHLSLGEFLEEIGTAAGAQLSRLVKLDGVAGVNVDDSGGYGSPTSLALAYGYGAVRLGADLLLNTEARLLPGGLELRRLDITREMKVVVAQTLPVKAAHVIVAAGAAGSELLEHDLGVVTPHGRAFVQYPRLELAPAAGLPVLRRAGFTLRPGEGGLRVLPPAVPADPAGYVPVGGRLTGVPVGVRREVLSTLLDALEELPALGSDRLNLGRSVHDVPGAWEVRPAGGWPLWETPLEGVSLLLGGPESDRVGPAVAYDLAATLAGVTGRPWETEPRGVA